MKKFISILLCIALVFTIAACGKAENDPPVPKKGGKPVQQKNEMPFDKEQEFYYSSGAGAWGTELIVQPDGSFTGYYHDSNMGEGGDGYLGTCYISNFKGKFKMTEQQSENSYALELVELTLTDPAEEWIEDDTRYVPTTPAGIEDGKNFVLYMPETQTEGLPFYFISWWPQYFADEVPETLDCYGLYNVDAEAGFFTY